ncbi:MAG: YebC/PmpR family DNA-binding transcriptional regulator [Bacteroidales bacterium]|nr:YebC/PmpR family DNA-binding transcriptional regulator [Bacteroidales bacterium]
MGRAFEFRKERKFKRWGHMAKTFTKIGKEITIAVKNGGPDVTGNPRLRALLQTARSENMPKENIERAIKKATDKDQADYKEVVYEGYGPHGVAILVETATDNTNRTVANVRSYFNKFGGSLGTSGSVSFMFDHKCVFKIKNNPDIDIEELELELIDFGADEVFVDEFENKDGDTEEVITIYGEYTAFNSIQKYIEDKGYELVSAGFDRFPNGEMKQLSAEDRVELDKLLEKLEEDDDVQNVFHNLAEAEE